MSSVQQDDVSVDTTSQIMAGLDASQVDLTDRYRLAFECGLRSLTQQEGSLDSVRARAATLIAAISISTSFLGGASISRGILGVWGIVGLGSFAIAIALCIAVLWPRSAREHSRESKRGWFFRLDPATLITRIDEQGHLPLSAWYKGLACEIGRGLVENDRRLRWNFRAFQGACSFLVIEIVCWTVQLG